MMRQGIAGVVLMAALGVNALAEAAGWPPAGEAAYLPVEKAFPFQYRWRGNQVLLQWNPAQGYALYKQQFRIEPASAGVTWTVTGTEEYDPDAEPQFRSKFTGPVEVAVVIENPRLDQLTVTYQGCSLRGLCYPPQRAVLPRH